MQLKNRLETTAKEEQIKEILDLRLYFDRIMYTLKYEWSLASLENDKFFIGDNFIFLHDLNEMCIPISLDKAILIRPKNPNKRTFYLEKTNKKYLTRLGARSLFNCSCFQDANSNMLIGDKEKIDKFLKIKNTLLDKNTFKGELR